MTIARILEIKPVQIILALCSALTLMLSMLTLMPQANAISVGGPSDCDNNAVIRCGAHSTGALKDKYRASDYVQKVFAHFGISNSDMNNLDNTNVIGKVTNKGNVYIEGQDKPVATGAMTAGRQNMPGSTPVTSGGITFYKRSPSVSFQQQSLPAFVSMKDGRFQFAVLASCGNPVSAAPETPPAPKPQPQPQPTQPQAPAPQPTPPAPAPVQQQVQEQKQEVIVQAVTPPPEKAPPPAPAPAPAPAPTPQALPSVGPESIGGLFAASTAAGILGYRRWRINRPGI